MRVGRWELSSLVDATFALDGGALFGAVPRGQWAAVAAPDADNRVALAARCLLAVDASAGRVLLVDPGPGTKWDAARAARHALARPPGGGLVAELARRGLAPGDVTDVLLTHLHRHHAGGVTVRAPSGALALAFPRADHHVQRRHWAWAHAPSEKDGTSFDPADFELLARSDRLHLVEGEAELLPDLELVVAEGHTTAQQLPRFHGDGTHVTFCGDLVPTRAHLTPTWVTAWDLRPLTALEEKKVLLAEALEDGGVLALGHDREMAACRLGEVDGRPVFREAVAL